MSKLPYLQLFPADFLEDAMMMSNEEAGIYIKMICQSHIQKEIPKKRLPFLAQIEWNELSSFIQDKFIDTGESVVNKRVHKSIVKHENFIEKQRINGAKGGRPKTQKNLSTSISNSNTISNTNTNSKKIPALTEFLDYANIIYSQLDKDIEPFLYTIKAKYQTWKDDGWKNGHGKPIKNWKNTLNNTLPYLKPIYDDKNKNRNNDYTDAEYKSIEAKIRS